MHRRGTPRRVLPVRARRRFGCGGLPPKPSGMARTTSSTAPRRGSPTRGWRTSTTCSAAPAGPAPRASPACSPIAARRDRAAEAGTEDGIDGFAGCPGRLRRCPGPRRPSRRRRGHWLHHRADRSGLWPAGIAACAVGLAQAALEYAVDYAKEREQFGSRSSTSRAWGSCSPTWPPRSPRPGALTLAAARLRDAGRPYSTEAAKAKLFATDMAMRVTTDAVQVLGGYGYVRDHPVERYMREAKMLQIVEGTNQIQRLVLSRTLTRP